MTDREKLLDTLKVAYEPRKIPQEDGSVAIHYPTDEDVADMIEAAIIDEYKHRIEVVERALDKACEDIKQLMDCCRWAAGGGVITFEECTLEKATPQAYIERSEKGEE